MKQKISNLLWWAWACTVTYVTVDWAMMKAEKQGRKEGYSEGFAHGTIANELMTYRKQEEEAKESE